MGRQGVKPLWSALAIVMTMAGCSSTATHPPPTTTPLPASIPTMPPAAANEPSATPIAPTATIEPTATLPLTLPVSQPSPTPAKMARGPGVEWHLVVLSESTGWGLGEACASRIEKDVGVKVTLADYAIGDLSAGDVLDEQLTETSSVSELEGLPQALANADVVLLGPSPMRSIDNDAFQSIQRCFGNAAGRPAPCTSKDSEKFTADLEVIWAKIFELRLGKPTILRGLDSASPFISRWNRDQIFDACTTCWECYSSAARKAAEAFHIPFLSRYDVFNGVEHNLDLGQLGYLGADGIHPNDSAQHYSADLLGKLGYDPVPLP